MLCLEWNVIFKVVLYLRLSKGCFLLQHSIFCNAVMPSRWLKKKKEKKKSATPFERYWCNLVDYSGIQDSEVCANKTTLVKDNVLSFIYATYHTSVRNCLWKKTPQFEFCANTEPFEKHSLHKRFILFKFRPLILPKRHQANQNDCTSSKNLFFYKT